jgi:iron complex outermembrane receptor protein
MTDRDGWRRTISRRTRLACGAALAVFAMADAGAAMAQASDDGTSVGEVVVTARKREERLRDVPIAASVVDAEVIEKRATVADTGAIVTMTPGARFNDLAFTVLSEVSLRASGTARGTNAETGIGLYANGVYVGGGLQFARNFVKIDFFDLGRAEVLRGTLGALYGRNAVGGAINLISQQPVYENTGRVWLDWSPDTDKKLVSAVVNMKGNDVFALRIGAEYIDQDKGKFHEYNLGRYADEQHGWIVRGQARIRTGDLDAVAMIQHQNMDIGGGAATFKAAAGTGCPATAASACYLRDYSQTRYELPYNTHTDIEQDILQGVLTINYDLHQIGKLTSTTSVRERRSRFVSDNDLTDAATFAALRTAGIISGGANQRTDSFQDLIDVTTSYYQDLHLAGETGPLTYLGGVEFLRIGSHYEPAQITANPVGAKSVSGLDYDSLAFYGALGYDVTEQLNLSAEVRHTKDDKSFWQFSQSIPSNAITAAVFTRTFENSNWSYNLVANYHITPTWIAYAKVGTGYRAGGFNTGVNPAPPAVAPRPVTPTFDNEKSTTFEGGAKGNLSRDLYVTLAAYKTKVDGAITQVDNGCFQGNPVCNARPTNYAINGGDADIWGVELEGVLRYELGPGRGQLRGAASRQQGEFDGGVYDGFTIPQTPKWLYSFNLDYIVPVGTSSQAFANVNYKGQRGGKEGVAVGTTPPKPLEEFNVFDLRTGVRFKQTEVAVYVNNFTNDRYTLIDAATSVRWSLPRTWGLQLRQRW